MLTENGYRDAGAVFDPQRTFRYALWRTWATDGPLLLWVMLNPSTADEHVLDPTLRKVEGFSRRHGCRGFAVANVYAYRSTDPKKMLALERQGVDVVGPDNDAAIRSAAESSDGVVVGWGKHARPLRVRQVANILAPYKPMCLRTNDDGSPQHPLYIPYEQAFEPWRMA